MKFALNTIMLSIIEQTKELILFYFSVKGELFSHEFKCSYVQYTAQSMWDY